jgi:ATP-dependent Lon protease
MNDRIEMFADAGRSEAETGRVSVPEELPILPLRNTVAFPGTVLPLAVGIERSVRLVQEAAKGDRLVGLVAMRDPKIKEPKPGQTCEVGTLARLEHISGSGESGLQVIAHCQQRFRIQYWLDDAPYLRARVEPAPA